MDKMVAFDQIQSVTDVAANEAGTNAVNGVVTFRGNIRKKGWGFQGKMCVYGALGAPTTTSHCTEITHLF